MKYPLRNVVLDKIRQQKNLTDAELLNILAKDGVQLTEAQFNKILLDLEIYGQIKVGWITKDKRRIEVTQAREELRA